MSTFISVLILIVCFFLIIVVLIQNSKGGGIASNFAASNQVMGVKKQAELIEKITWGLAIALLVLSLSSGMFASGTGTTTQTDTGKDPVTKGAELPGNVTPAPTPATNQGGNQPMPIQIDTTK